MVLTGESLVEGRPDVTPSGYRGVRSLMFTSTGPRPSDLGLPVPYSRHGTERNPLGLVETDGNTDCSTSLEPLPE